MLALPAKLVVGDTVSLIQKQRPFLFPLFTHSWQYDHLPSFFNPSRIPFALLFRFQGAMKRSFTYSHWERANSNPDFEKISSLIPTGSSQMHTLNGKNILNLKSPLTYLELRSRNAPCFLKKSSKISLECSAAKKRKRMVLRIRFQIGTLPGRFSPFFCPVRRFQKAGKGRIPFCRFLRNVRFRVLKKRLFSCLKFA